MMTVVVIGNGMVGMEFLRRLVESDWSGDSIVVFGAEPHAAYDRVALSTYMEHGDPNRLALAPNGFFAENGIELHTHTRIVSLDRKSKCVVTEHGEVTEYDVLVLATGAKPYVPPALAVCDVEGLFVYRTLADLDAIRSYGKGKHIGVIVGGGLLGLEAARALSVLGLQTHIVERAPHLMPAQLGTAGAELLGRLLRAQGYTYATGCDVVGVTATEGRVSGLQCAGREDVECDVVVISAGIVPNDDLGRQAGLELGKRGGIAVDDRCQTSDPHIYAVGECASFGGRTYGLVAPGYHMARVAAASLAGGNERFEHAETSTKLKLAGVDVAAVGPAEVDEASVRTWEFTDTRRGRYFRLSLAPEANLVRKCTLVGDCGNYDAISSFYDTQVPLTDDMLSHLINGTEFDPNPSELPNDAVICSCKNVTNGQLWLSITEGGAWTLPAVKSCTGAGTGCEGCVSTLKKVLKHARSACGHEVSEGICSHFQYSRRRLMELCRLYRISTLEQALEELGAGSGCEICQPAIASILSVTSPHLIVDDKHVAAQDFNDRYLANVQRDGTYSVIPRLPGGEVSASQMLTLGNIAKDFSLYLRVTGGQRIAFFGARIEQLPAVWRRLVDSGFESGHTYGKALRTIKTCVGLNWCPWAVQDSTRLAIRLEHRYRGLRSPHKTKAAVSGCVRDCAEAKIKDFGLIATDQGWNIMIAGNGGRDAAMGKLLAQDVDDETVVKYLDRLLMYYVRTADHLARTVTWISGLEGGIERVREVVVDDVLGIAQELEDDMQRLVDAYRCEWSAALDDENVIRRFRHYTNSDQSDPLVFRVAERAQHRAATPEERRARIQEPQVSQRSLTWQDVVEHNHLLPNMGVNALVGGQDVAVFRMQGNDALYAIDNVDPFSIASVLSRGVVGEDGSEPFVISPISRKAFSLRSGECLVDHSVCVSTHHIRVRDGWVQVRLRRPHRELMPSMQLRAARSKSDKEMKAS